MSAAYKTVEDEPDSLFLFAADKRSFRIGSLDVKTFSLSRDFIERYTIRRMIHELIDGSGSSKTPRTPITKRNIEWLVKQYIRQIVPKDKNIRYIYNPWSAGIVTNDQGAQTLTKPRHSRPVHKAEIRKIFAKHCEWILADQIAALRSPNARYLDIPQWYKFVQECRVVNPPAVGGRSDIASSLTRFGGKREDWQKRIDNALATPLHWQQERELQKASRKALPRVTPSAQPPLHQPRPIQPLTRHSPVVPSSKFQYDSDFSEASTPPLSDSESEVADQRLLEKIPWYCRVPPELESHHLWRCPGCRVYQIDLLHLDDDELEEIPEQFAKTLRSIRSKADDVPKSDEVLVAFGHLVHQHYERHLRELGVQIVDEDGDVSVRKWPEERTRRKSRRLNTRSASAA
ncbi:hypothetical protein NP233_g7923 [Leucocoprinus birnbaumii]|uniref:Uncharacterized protein n=1 Tax=Leucocoprinus birnbaumii TaxID=56174 RepID=A0AAD5VPZ4_9AGAR|nr:hypothetical protein NP233_g7923 [Leucocoprinus birnbaumii]